jgi:hypothetical protein
MVSFFFFYSICLRLLKTFFLPGDERPWSFPSRLDYFL